MWLYIVQLHPSFSTSRCAVQAAQTFPIYINKVRRLHRDIGIYLIIMEPSVYIVS